MAAPLIPGFRFNPTDDQIVRLYLINKILGRLNPHDRVTTEDVYETSPEKLPLDNNGGLFNDNEWYFYTTRTSQDLYVTRNGYYLETSKDKEIFHNNRVVGFKRILRFYLGRPRAPMETEYYVHEFRFNPIVFPAARELGIDVQKKISNLVMCKIVRKQELSDNDSEETVKDEGGSSQELSDFEGCSSQELSKKTVKDAGGSSQQLSDNESEKTDKDEGSSSRIDMEEQEMLSSKMENLQLK